jgi:glycerol-3-phosphate acyltransferase PlsX
MILAIDAMGGDNAPEEIVKGTVMFVKKYNVSVYLIGIEEMIKKELDKYDDIPEIIEIINAQDVITNEDIPTKAIKKKKDSSLVKGFEMLKNKEIDAFISAGNTGAIMTGSLLKVGRIKGISRPALAPIIPNDKGCSMLIDAGANTNCKPDNLVQFALMGTAYMKNVMKVANPLVGLANIGTEEEKGNDLVKSAYKELKKADINFYGNIEARDIPKGAVDIIVCDGFVGNIILKLTEGIGEWFYNNIKEIFTKNAIAYLSALFLKEGLKKFKKKVDYNEYGGAPFLGINGVVIKAHGSAKASSVYFSLVQAKKLVDGNVIGEINEYFVY